MAAVEVAPAPVQAVANGNHAEANGNMEHVAESVEQTEQTEQTEPEEPREHRLYFVRIPRPTFDDSALKKLDAELGTCFTKLKAINNKAQVKRGEANELRKQLGVARSLRNGSSPEWEEKMTRLKQLREMRKAILDKIAEYKQGRQGLECRTEQELDDKIAEMEHAIQHGEMSLAEEKATVRNIAKLRGQREKIRELEGQQESLAQMEAEARKIKAVIDEVDSEMNILRGERDQAKDIIDDLQGKLTAVNAVLADYDAERQDLESTKREIQDQLKTLREEIDSHMFEYRANRKLSLQLRDLVADGKLEDAQAMAQQQVEAQLSKMTSDVAYRKEYNKLWSEQRKYLVSELLPNSGAVEAKPAPAAAGKGGKKADRSAAPLVPQGAAKAQAIIAAALAEAELAVAAKRKEEPAPVHQDEETEEHSEEPAAEPEPAVRTVPGASEEFTAVTKSKASKPAYNYAKVMSEMPEVVHDYEYIMPPTAAKDTEQLSAAELKAKVREEQRQKAAEAEARKKRRQEQLAKKQALAKQKAAEQAAAAATAASTALAPVSRAAAVVAEEAEVGSGADGDAESGAEQQAVSQPKPKQRGKQHMLSKANKQLAAAVKKPVVKKPVKVQKWYQQYSTELAIGGVCVLMLILLILYFTQ